MELKVWVEGIQRVVCGVCERTTCQDVVYALAHATGKTGRFTLIERWRNNERLLAPHEHPLKVLMKWGEYSSDVHFILQRTALDTSNSKNALTSPLNNKSARPTKTSVDPLHGFTPPSPPKDLKKSLTFSGGAREQTPPRINVGVVRGVPKQPQQQTDNGDDWTLDKSTIPPPPPYYQPESSPSSDLVYPRYEPPYGRVRQPINGSTPPPPELHDPVRYPPPYRNPPPPFTGGARQAPPYREPPRPSPPYRSSPRPSPVRHDENPALLDGRDDTSRRSRRNLRLELVPRTPSPPSDPQQAQLIQRVNRQRGALDEQQERLVQLEQELLGWEERLHRRLDDERQNLNRELTQLEEHCRQQENQLSDLLDVESEWERACREGQDLTDELARLRSDVSSLDSQLDQSTPTLRNLRSDIAAAEDRLAAELDSELARVKADLETAGQDERKLQEDEQIANEDIVESEAKLRSLRSEMDQLTQEIKQANLQSLSIAPADDLKVLLEGSYKTGHSRRMLGSPRQLENPVPTNKNPHGVWV